MTISRPYIALVKVHKRQKDDNIKTIYSASESPQKDKKMTISKPYLAQVKVRKKMIISIPYIALVKVHK
jgi:hypothetical protein